MNDMERPLPPDAGSTDWLVDGGEMGKLIRSMDWSQTPLGPRESWPQSLRTTLSLCLASNFPIGIIWGPQRIQFYNDGYVPIAGGKHPNSMGQDFRECWILGWPVIGKPFDQAVAGKTAFLESVQVFIDRNGYLEEAFFTASFSPIRDDKGRVAGVFHPTVETTQQVLGERRVKALRSLADRTAEARTVEQAVSLAVDTLAGYDLDLPFVLIYLLESDGKSARLAGAAGLSPETPASPMRIELEAPPERTWPLAQVLKSGRAEQVDRLAERLGPIACRPYPEPVNAALIMPIAPLGLDHPLGCLIAGVSTRRALDEPYRNFYELLSAGITTALGNARAYEEERWRADALAEIDRAKTVFFSNVSHEFRTPLTLMLGPLEEALRDASRTLGELDRQRLETAYRNALRLLKLVNALLNFARLEAGRTQATFIPTDLAKLTAELASMFNSAVESGEVELAIDCPPLPEPVFVDPDLWEKIVLNLVSNAFKFTFKGRIEVRLRWQDGEAVLTVADTGTGIPPEHLPRLFERFHRVPNTRGRSYEGTGIGLSLVQELVKLHGGTIEVESVLDQGSTFTVSLPAGSAHLPAERIAGPKSWTADRAEVLSFVEEARQWAPAEMPLRQVSVPENAPAETLPVQVAAIPARILLADDNADMRRYIAGLLSAHWQVEAVTDGVEALAAVRRNLPDLVVTDIMMPNLDGFGLLREIRNDPRTRTMPVIMVSARAGEEARVEGLQAGANDYLVKPFGARELLARVSTQLELARLLQVERLQAARLAGLMESAMDAIVTVDRSQRIVLFNRAAEKMFGIRSEEILGQPLDRLIPERFRAIHQDQVEHFGQTGVTSRAMALDRMITGLRADGTEFPIEASISKVDEGDNRFYTVILRDITERMRLQEELLKANQSLEGRVRERTAELARANEALLKSNEELGQFAYIASHDLQTPLRSIAGFTQLLQREYGKQLDGDANALIERVVKATKRLQAMITDLLVYSRVDSQASPFQPVDFKQIVETVLAALEDSIRETGAEIVFGDLPVVLGDRLQLSQLVQNLLENAIKYHGTEAPRVEISAQPQGDRWQFSVQDNGIGIAPDQHERIFKIFRRLHTQQSYPGTGIGLALCHRVVERHGGRIWVESEPGKGSTFLFTLPKPADTDV